MSIKLMTRVWEASPCKGAALLIHLALADHANDEGRCWPHLPSLMVKARASRATVYRALAQMKADGLLIYEGDDLARPSQDVPFWVRAVSNRDLAEGCQSQDETQTVSPRDSEGVHTSLIEPSVEPPSDGTSSVVTDVTLEFDHWWGLYPKRVGKGAARAAYARAIKKTTVGTLNASVEAYAASRKGQDKQYTLNPATWLNQERWEDEIQNTSRVGILPDAPMPEWMKKLYGEEEA